MWPATQRHWHRAALALERHYRGQRSARLWFNHQSEDLWRELLLWQSRLSLAEARESTATSQVCRARLRAILPLLQADLTGCVSDLALQAQHPAPPTLRLLLDELHGLEAEFEAVTIDLRQATITVQTERIVLEEIDLGPFEIRLHWKSLATSSPYDVVALDPFRPGGNPDVTHPHVQCETLCEGEGTGAITGALAAGRLGDFFVLVRQVLRTYNEGSAYQHLSDWHGATCTDCGGSVAEDDECRCDRCDSSLCPDCAHFCEGCQSSLCRACAAFCPACAGRTCPDCLQPCATCGGPCCPACHEKPRCPDCPSLPLEPEHAAPENAAVSPPPVAPPPAETPFPLPAAPSGAPLQSHRLGETPLSA